MTKETSKSWKDHLLRSGAPLEFQVAKALTAAGMSVDADFSFLRRDINGIKEWSVDIASIWYSSPNKIEFQLQVLVECKFRSQNKTILLMPDPNEQFSPVTVGGTLNILDQFSRHHLSSTPITDFERAFEFIYKAIEIHNGGAHEDDLRHAFQQLRYATPPYLKRSIEFAIDSHPEDRAPTFFSKILVTNAPLRCLDGKISIGEIRDAGHIDDISTEVTSAIMYSDYGPDYEDHFRQTFNHDRDRLMNAARELADELRSNGKVLSRATDPSRLIESFGSASRYECRNVSTQFFVTTLNALPQLLKSMKAACWASYKLRSKKERSAEWLQELEKDATRKSRRKKSEN